MKIYINDTEYNCDDGSTLQQAILVANNIPDKGIAIAVNNDVIPNSEWNTFKINNGDRITIIKAFYGG